MSEPYVGSESLVDVRNEESHLTATDVSGNALRVDARGWVSTDTGPSLTARADEVVSGRVTELQFETEQVAYRTFDGSTERILEPFDVDPLQLGPMHHLQTSVDLALPDAAHLLQADGAFRIQVRTDDEFTLSWRPADQHVTLTFPRPTPVTLGFRSAVEYPRATMTVEPTPTGVATAMSHFAASHRTVEPELSFPTMRGHPPAVEFGSTTTIPDAVREQTPTTGIEIVVPPSMDALLPVAPLAYYTAARVSVADTDPEIRVPAADFTHQLADPPTLQYQAARLLRRVVTLDGVVRTAGPWGSDLDESTALARSPVALEVEELYDRPLHERLVAYLNCEFEPIEAEMPPWRHWVQVPNETETLRSLPTVLSDMAAIFMPGAAEAAIAETTGANRVADWELVTGRLTSGDGDPWTTGYTSTRDAYRHRLADTSQGTDTETVTVVVTDSEAGGVGDWLTDQYQRRLGEQGVVESRRVTTAAALADLLAQPTDMLHLVGECTSDGLACPDGPLELAQLATNEVNQFILDTTTATDRTDAVAVAERLVERGSIAGVVSRCERRPRDLNGATASHPAFTVGGLIQHGFAIETARRVTREVHDRAELAVIGDGSHRLLPAGFPTFLLSLETTEDGQLEVVGRSLAVAAGAAIGNVATDVALSGNELVQDFDASSFRRNVVGDELVIYDGDLYWPEDTDRLLYPIA